MIGALTELAITLCGLFIIISVVESILPQGSVSSGIKWVILIYVLVTLIGSLAGIETEELTRYFETDSRISIESAGDEVLTQAVTVLEERAASTLSAAGIEYGSVEVELIQNEHGINISAVKITGDTQLQREQIQEKLDNVFGETVEVIYE